MRRIPLTNLFGVEDTNHHFETSWLLPPVLLSGLRSLIALYIFTSIFFFWGWYGTHENTAAIGQSFSFFTWLTYWGIGFYMLFAAIHTGYYARTGRSLLDRWPRALRILHSLLYSSITTYPFLVTIVFWVLLFRPPWYTKTFTGWQNVSVNSVFRAIRSAYISTPTYDEANDFLYVDLSTRLELLLRPTGNHPTHHVSASVDRHSLSSSRVVVVPVCRIHHLSQ